MAPTWLQTKEVSKFRCRGAECPDTCCEGWGMQLMEETVTKYAAQAPELLSVVSSGEAEFVMKRNPVTDRCVKLEQGWCAIQRDYGEDFLGEACHFFPRISRAVGEMLITTAALSCPETAQLMLYGEDGLAFTPRAEVRTPYILRNYLPEGMREEEVLAIHTAMVELAGDPSVGAGHSLMRVSTVARALEVLPMKSWKEAVPLYISMADGRIPAAEPQATDMFFLVHALYGLVMASKKPRSSLLGVVEAMAGMLGVTFEAGGLCLAADSEASRLLAMTHMGAQAKHLQPVLRRYLQAQLSLALFPFSGLGNTLGERITIIGVRLATIKLALATLPEQPDPADVVRVIQVVSRFMDHLASPQLSLQIYCETGWVREARLRSLMME